MIGVAGRRMLVAVVAVLAIAGCGPRGTSGPRSASGTDVVFTTADNWTIHGDFSVPANATKAVILLHQRNGSAGDWKPLTDSLNQGGVATLALDLRGAGRSTGPQNGDNAPWDVTGDIDGARKYLDEHGLKGKPVGLAGASYGANNALIYAASHADIAAVVLISPGDDYHGLKVEDAAKQYHGHILQLASSGDSITGRGPQVIAEAAKPVTTTQTYDGDAHGTEIFRAHSESVDAIATFVQQNVK